MANEMFLGQRPEKEKINKKVFKCHYCKKSYRECDCYASCPDCKCPYRKINPCNSYYCKNKNNL